MLNFLKKSIKKIFYILNIQLNLSDDIAVPIISNKVKLDDKFFSLYSFGELNKKKRFYVIRRTPGAGLFSNVIYVLNHISIAKKHGFIPIVDMDNFRSIYNENKLI